MLLQAEEFDMSKDEKNIGEPRTRHLDRDADATGSGSNDREPASGAERKRASKGDVTDIGTDAQQADGTAAGPSTS